MSHVIGIDAGGTKTTCLLADGQGRVMVTARGGGANLKTVGELGVEKVLHTVMDEVLAHSDGVPAAICLGIAGVDRPSDNRTAHAIMRRIALRTRTLVVNDALIALVAGVGDGPGVVLIAGTGSIAYGRDGRNRAARAGGWGHILGDEGSGYWIGRRALAAVMREADGRGSQTALTPRVLARFGLSRAPELVPLVYDQGLPLPVVASLGGLVQDARDAGDREAAIILQESADELVLAAWSVVSRLEMGCDRFTFVLSGGMFQAIPWLVAEVSARLTTFAAMASVRKLEIEPATGAVHLALGLARGEVNVPVYVAECAP